MASVAVKPQIIDTDLLIEEYGYDDHFHDHHHGDKYQSGFIGHYIFSMDHKMIAKQFLITGMIWAIIGGLMSLVFRLQLGFPGESIAWLKPVLGKWIAIDTEGIGTLQPDFYYALVTMHGTILVFFVLTAGLSGTFSNLL
ncbi:MAG: cbb3-type cytochrome c oxidase subunit I, partial [Bacteroidota bacterium]